MPIIVMHTLRQLIERPALKLVSIDLLFGQVLQIVLGFVAVIDDILLYVLFLLFQFGRALRLVTLRLLVVHF